MRCLIVDDDTICRKAVLQLLHELAECDEATNGGDALAMFSDAHRRGNPYDVIVLDILMPGSDGHETAQAMRNIERAFGCTDEVKIVMVTVLDSINDAMRAFCSSHCVAYMVKPVSEEKFLKTFRELAVF